MSRYASQRERQQDRAPASLAYRFVELASCPELVECQATFAVLMSRRSRGLLVLRLRQWMYRRMSRGWVAWSGWSVPASVKYLSARNWVVGQFGLTVRIGVGAVRLARSITKRPRRGR